MIHTSSELHQSLNIQILLNTSCPTAVCSNQGGGGALKDYFQVRAQLSVHCWLWCEQSSHSRGPLEAVSSLLAQETWQKHSLISAAALSGPGRWHVNPLNFTNGSDENSKLKKSSVDHCAALAQVLGLSVSWGSKISNNEALGKSTNRTVLCIHQPKEHLINVNESYLTLFQLTLGKMEYCLIQG